MEGTPDRPIAQRVAAGAAWMVSLQFASRAIGLLSLPILARLLLPEDFGVLAMAWAVVSLVGMLGAFGILRALIREQNASRDLYDTAWTLNVLKGLAIAALVIAAAPFAGAQFDDPRIVPVIYMLAITCILDGFSNIGVVDFQKELRFRRQFIFDLSGRLAGFAMTICLAYWWRDYWALVWGSLFASAIAFTASYLMHPFRPRVSLSAFNVIFRFSRWSFIHEVSAELGRKIPILMTGRAFTTEIVAYFSVANEIARTVSTELQGPVTKALFPGLAKIASERSKLAAAYLDILGVKLLVFLPLTVGIVLVGPHLVRIILGENWLAVVPLLQILSLAGVIEIFRSNNSTFLLVGDWPHLAAAISGLRLVIMLAAVTVGLSLNGVVGVAWAVIVTSAVVASVSFTLVNRILRCSLHALWRRCWRSIVAAGGLCIAVLNLRYTIWTKGDLESAVLELMVIVLAGAATYILIIAVLWRLFDQREGPERAVLRLAQNALALQSRP